MAAAIDVIMLQSIVLSSQISPIPNEFPIVLCFQLGRGRRTERTARENQKQSLCILIASLYILNIIFLL